MIEAAVVMKSQAKVAAGVERGGILSLMVRIFIQL